MDMKAYPYSQLQVDRPHIRLLSISPGLDYEQISCRLVITLLEEAKYEALSYTWGESDESEIILVDGYECLITPNLNAALRRLRWVTRERTLWVDAICINQKNIEEKNHQVQIMRHIYANAAKVIVWLGEKADDSDMAMYLLEDICSEEDMHKPLFFNNPESAVVSSEWKSVMAILERSWWLRTWPVQELLLAKEPIFYCGQRSTEWTSFWLGVQKIGQWTMSLWEFNNEHPFKASMFQRVSALWLLDYTRANRNLTRPFSYLLYWQRFRKVTDSRDRIYAMAGLSLDATLELPAPDYSKSVQEVYQATTWELIRQTQRLDILRYAGLNLGASDSPSWVPDWEYWASGSNIVPYVTQLESDNVYRASEDSRAILEATEDSNVLVLTGVSYDNVASLGGICHPLDQGAKASWVAMTKLQEEPLRPYIGGSNFFDAFWRTNIANLSFDRGSSPDESSSLHFEAPEHDALIFRSLYNKRNLMGRTINSSELVEFVRRMDDATNGRRMILTSRGYLAMAPAETQEGDSVCVLHGGDMPFVLRRRGASYQLIGETYVHGLMKGEALQAIEEGLAKSEVFHIE